MNMAELIGLNIDKLREQNGLSVEGLAELIGVTRQTMTNYIKGRQVIDSGKLAIIAKYFNKPFDYFMDENQSEFSLMFRADNPEQNFNEELAERIIKKIRDTGDLLELSGNKLTLIPESYRLRYSGKRLNREEKEMIEDIAGKKREEFGIADVVPENIYQVLQENEINVLSFPFHNSSIFAVSAYSDRYGSFIIVNDDVDIPEERKIFSSIHELGHLIFHKDQYSKGLNSFSHAYGKKRDINEEVANHFAMCFLVSRELLKKHRNSFKNKAFVLKEVVEIKKQLQVSAKCLIYALEYYGYITEKQKGIHIGYLNKNGYVTAEPRPMQPIKKDSYWVPVIKDLFNRGEISFSKVTELFDISLSQARKIAKDWVTENEPAAIF